MGSMYGEMILIKGNQKSKVTSRPDPHVSDVQAAGHNSMRMNVAKRQLRMKCSGVQTWGVRGTRPQPHGSRKV